MRNWVGMCGIFFLRKKRRVHWDFPTVRHCPAYICNTVINRKDLHSSSPSPFFIQVSLALFYFMIISMSHLVAMSFKIFEARNPAGSRGSLQVLALGSEQPGPQHLVSRKCKRPGVHPEADWEHTACSGGSAPQSLGSRPEASGRRLQISALGSRTA